ncbi:calcium-binding protein [filamentous cyanobacterium CCP2]|nr:calcium-binding protein [filamentous cyanobacterium CCP2]
MSRQNKRNKRIIRGDNENNLLTGTEEKEKIFGLGGDDTIIGGRGDDYKFGGRGNDRFIWNNGDGSDVVNGGVGNDVVEVNGSNRDDQFVLKQKKRQAIFERTNFGKFTIKAKNVGEFEINGGEGNDSLEIGNLSRTKINQVTFNGGEGNDILNAQKTSVNILALGENGDDTLAGGAGDDTIIGGRGSDVMIGNDGNDRLIWNNGDGSDQIDGGNGFDTVEVNDAATAGDQFALNQNGNRAIFDRLNLVPFTLDTQNAEVFEINATGGDDSLVINDLSSTPVQLIQFSGGEGNDTVDGSNTAVNIFADGGAGDDLLTGSSGNDTLVGGAGVNTLRGGLGNDRFVYGGSAINNPPDELLDYEIGIDQFGLVGSELGISDIRLQNGISSEIAADGNVIVLQNPFANAGAAADAIAANDAITSNAGAFIYHNFNLGISRLVRSEDLANRGAITVLANIRNQAGDEGIANLPTFSANDFVVV